MLVIPTAWMSFGLLLALLLVFTVAQQFGAGTVWGSLMRDITTDSDRGQFFARMRFSFTTVNAITLFVFSLVITSEMTALDYKALLGLSVLGQTEHALLGIPRFPTRPIGVPSSGRRSLGGYKRFIITLRTSPLLRLPLLISIFMQLSALPLMAVYLRTMLHVPAQLVSFYLLSSTIGSAISFLIWGKIADTLGFPADAFRAASHERRSSPPSTCCSLRLTPPSLSACSEMNLAGNRHRHRLALHGLHERCASPPAPESPPPRSSSTMSGDATPWNPSISTVSSLGLVAAGVALFSGFYLESFALPRGMTEFGNGIFHFDWVKAWMVIAVPCLQDHHHDSRPPAAQYASELRDG